MKKFYFMLIFGCSTEESSADSASLVYLKVKLVSFLIIFFSNALNFLRLTKI